MGDHQAAHHDAPGDAADILTKAVDVETHTKMRNLMMNISWVYKGNTAKMTRLVKALTDTLSRMA